MAAYTGSVTAKYYSLLEDSTIPYIALGQVGEFTKVNIAFDGSVSANVTNFVPLRVTNTPAVPATTTTPRLP